MKLLKLLFFASAVFYITVLVFFRPLPHVERMEALPAMGSAPENSNAQYSAVIQLIEDGRFICSGVVFDSLYALTASHCLDGSKFTIRDSKGRDTGVEAVTAGRNGRVDFGIIKGDFSKFKFMTPEFYKEGFLAPGPFIACGFPYGQKDMLCTPFTPLKREGFMIGGLGSLYPGMSGGPVIDVLTNKIVGVNSAVGDFYTYVTSIVGAAGCFGIEP